VAEGVVLCMVDVHHEGTKDTKITKKRKSEEFAVAAFGSNPASPILVFFVLFVSFVPLWFKITAPPADHVPLCPSAPLPLCGKAGSPKPPPARTAPGPRHASRVPC